MTKYICECGFAMETSPGNLPCMKCGRQGMFIYQGEKTVMEFHSDPTYIEMCRKADEIQTQRPRCTAGRVPSKSSPDIEINHKGDFFIWMDLMSPVWLPRLDQLIEILGPSYQMASSYNISEEGITYGIIFNHGKGGAYVHGESLERCVLAAIMHKHHNKRWDFEKKEWVNV